MFSSPNMPYAKNVATNAGSIAASAMVIRSVARDLIPYELQCFILDKINSIFKLFSEDIVLMIEQYDGLASNQIYKAADLYLGSKILPNNQIFKVTMAEKETNVTTTMAKNQEMTDTFNGANFKWRQITQHTEAKHLVHQPTQNLSVQYEVKYYLLTFHKKYKEMVFESYFPFILKEANRLSEEKKTLKIYTLNTDPMCRLSGEYAWVSVNLNHPSTFDTLAMDDDLKREIVEDLETFVKRREFYRRVGKAWKRGYLLYGPPGTGKSSLIVAMANYLKFDIYDLDLTDIRSNSELRSLLVGTANRSILVVEDIDCSLDFDDRSEEAQVMKALKSAQANQFQSVNMAKQNQVTLSGLLNFIDGLWSSCGDERIIIFTTNHKDKLDPALLRPGRMDMHIHMSYCTPCAFRTLAFNYLGMTGHPLFLEVETLLEKTMVTPAEVVEQLLRYVDPDVALSGLVEFLHKKTMESDHMAEMEMEKEKEIQTQIRAEQS